MGSLSDTERSKYRVKETHRAHKAIVGLFEYLEKHKLEIRPAMYQGQVFDIHFEGHRFALHDLEEGPVYELPPNFEYVIGTDEIPPKRVIDRDV
jgi:hypothetical protein